jgi:WbqC-like protein
MVENVGEPEVPGRHVVVMQPYFFPYAGYFRLLYLANHFVILDCVQFPRRGRVHRTQVNGPSGAVEWLTLPLAKQRRDVLIRDLVFAPGARALLDARLNRHTWLAEAGGEAGERLRAYLYGPLGSVIDYLEAGLRLVADLLGLDPSFCRSSTLGLPPTLRSQQRIIAAVKALGGTHYLNAPGGRGLYDPKQFTKAGLTLSFLTPYRGPYTCFLPALLTHPLQAILADIRASSRLELPD